MSDSRQKQESDLELFLDGLMSEAEAKQFFENSDNPEEILRQQELQSKIDASMKRVFDIGAIDESPIARDLITANVDVHGEVQDSGSEKIRNNQEPQLTTQARPSIFQTIKNSQGFKLALACGLLVAIAMAVWLYNRPTPTITANFQPQALAKVYQETTASGFRPYYNCEDMDRFADTFEARQGKRLTLAEMPSGTQMLGLSYLGGTGRASTAMLGQVNNTPVIVFVDDAKNRQHIITGYDAAPDLNIYTQEKNGLIFCEVSPLESAKMIQYFEFVE